MRLCIAGSRTLSPGFGFLRSTISMFGLEKIKEIVSGGANGVDSEGEHFANHLEIQFTQFHADWDKHGKAAGPIRNKEMAQYSDVLLLIWDGESKGSANCRKEFEKLRKPIYEVILRKV